MKLVSNKLQVRHYAQVPCEPFCVDVKDEYEAYKIIQVLANQHLFLLEQNIIPDFSNAIIVVMYDEQDMEWVDYFNEEEGEEWDYIEQSIREQLETIK